MQLFLSVRCLFIFAVDVICCRLITVVVYEGRVTTVTWPTPAIVICRCRAKIWLDDSAWKWFFCGLTLFFWLCCALANEIMRRTMLSRISIYFHSIYFLDNGCCLRRRTRSCSRTQARWRQPCPRRRHSSSDARPRTECPSLPSNNLFACVAIRRQWRFSSVEQQQIQNGGGYASVGGAYVWAERGGRRRRCFVRRDKK